MVSDSPTNGLSPLMDMRIKLTAAEKTIERLRAALKELASQNLPDEMDDPDGGDYMAGYEALVLIAREALERDSQS